MSVQEIDRLLAFRKENKYVNSAKEFQEVTKVSDSLLSSMLRFLNFRIGFRIKLILKQRKKNLFRRRISKKKISKKKKLYF